MTFKSTILLGLVCASGSGLLGCNQSASFSTATNASPAGGVTVAGPEAAAVTLAPDTGAPGTTGDVSPPSIMPNGAAPGGSLSLIPANLGGGTSCPLGMINSSTSSTSSIKSKNSLGWSRLSPGDDSDSDHGDRDEEDSDDHDEANLSCGQKHDDEGCRDHRRNFIDHGATDDDDYDSGYASVGISSVKEMAPAQASFSSLDFYILVEEGGLLTCQVRDDGEVDPKKMLGDKSSCKQIYSVDSVQKERSPNLIHDVRLRTKSQARFQVVFDKLQRIYKTAKPGDKVHFHVEAIGKLKGPAIHVFRRKGLAVIRLDRCVVVTIDTSTCSPTPNPMPSASSSGGGGVIIGI